MGLHLTYPINLVLQNDVEPERTYIDRDFNIFAHAYLLLPD